VVDKLAEVHQQMGEGIADVARRLDNAERDFPSCWQVSRWV